MHYKSLPKTILTETVEGKTASGCQRYLCTNDKEWLKNKSLTDCMQYSTAERELGVDKLTPGHRESILADDEFKAMHSSKNSFFSCIQSA